MALFGTAGIRGDATDVVTPELALAVGRAVGYEAREEGIGVVVVGRDGRITGPGLAAAVEAGLQSAGLLVHRAGVLPTPALAYASRGRLGVMLTASHNPPSDNGIKLFRDGVEFDAAWEGRVEERVDRRCRPAEWNAWSTSEAVDVIQDYRAVVVAYARGLGAPLEGLSVAVDCGNGTGGSATPQVLRTLGGSVTALQANVDGHFPARPSKPTAEALAAFRTFVGDGSFALGIAHDGDADRVVVVDEDGGVVHEDTVVAILAERYVAESPESEPVVVTTPNASARIDERVTAAGGTTIRVPLGSLHEGVASARASGEMVAFAAEPWKHIHPGLGGWIDGVASAAVLCRLVAEAGGLAPLRAPITEWPYRKDEVACADDRKADAMARVGSLLDEQFPGASRTDEYGIRLEWPDRTWLLVRPSGTEPLIRLYAEGEEVDERLERAKRVVRTATSAG